jgi:hypothetical protein
MTPRAMFRVRLLTPFRLSVGVGAVPYTFLRGLKWQNQAQSEKKHTPLARHDSDSIMDVSVIRVIRGSHHLDVNFRN